MKKSIILVMCMALLFCIRADVYASGIRSENVTVVLDGLENRYRIAWVSDLHIMLPNQVHNVDWFNKHNTTFNNRIAAYNNSYNVVPDIIKFLNNNTFDIVIFGGDLLDNYSDMNLCYLRQQLSSLNKPYMIAAADHDYLTEMTTNSGENYSVNNLGLGNGVVKQYDISKGSDSIVIISQSFSNKAISQSDFNMVKNVLSNNENVLLFTHVPLELKRDDSNMQAWSKRVHNNQVYYWSNNASDSRYKPEGVQRAYINYLHTSTNLKGIFAGHVHASSGQLPFSGTANEWVFAPAFTGSIGVIEIVPGKSVELEEDSEQSKEEKTDQYIPEEGTEDVEKDNESASKDSEVMEEEKVEDIESGYRDDVNELEQYQEHKQNGSITIEQFVMEYIFKSKFRQEVVVGGGE